MPKWAPLTTSPKHAFEVVDRFLATAESVLNRVDDSGGAVGEIFRQAVLLWLTAAKARQEANVDWLERVYQLYQQNDYGVLDPLLPNAHLLLTQDQLKQLAWRYENELRKALKASKKKVSSILPPCAAAWHWARSPMPFVILACTSGRS